MTEVISKSNEVPKFFGDADRDKDGKVRSEYPCYYNEEHIETLKETINSKQIAIDMGYVADDQKARHRELLRIEEDRLEKIHQSTPELSDAQRDMLAKVRKSLGEKIAVLMFRRSEMEKGTADAHEEARRISTPCITLEPHEIPVVKNCDVFISNDGKSTRDGAVKAWKIVSRLLGEISNSEALRKP